ncbi:MAG: CHAT domain-containing protein [Anaerolineales bacterium]|nr:CHAT domain-containing protein [Anaerolineales bacterium]
MSTPLDPALIADLLAAPSVEAQISLLQGAGLADEPGLTQLLDHATGLVRTTPGHARRLAVLCATVATDSSLTAIIPPAAYLQAQTHALNGDFGRAAQLIVAARAGYQRLGNSEAALRTNVGLMHVLGESGRYEEALAAGQEILTGINGRSPHPLTALALHNRGTCFEQLGRYDEAIAAYTQAETTYQLLDMREPLGHVRNNRGLVLLSLGQARAALDAFTAAAAIYTAEGSSFSLARTWTNLGETRLLLGDYQQSLALFDQAHQFFQQQDALAEHHILLLGRAKAYLALNLFSQAQAAYQEVEELLRSAGMAHHHAQALWGLGMAHRAQQQFDEAATALAAANDAFAAVGNQPLQVSVLLEQAALEAVQGNRGVALQQAQQALALTSDHHWPIQTFFTRLRLADLLLPDAAAAESHLLVAQPISQSLALPHLRYRVNQRLGRLRLLQGDYLAAQQLLQTAVSDIEQLRGNLAQEALRLSFLDDKTAAYEDLIQLYLLQNEVEQAFATAEQAKSRTLAELLAGLLAVQQPANDDIAVRLQALQADLNAIYNEVLGLDQGSERRPRLLGNLNHQARLLEQEISQLRLQLPLGQPQGDPLLHAVLPSQPHLPPRATMLAYHIIGDEILAFVQHNGRLTVFRQLSSVTAVRQALQRLDIQWQRFRVGSEFISRHQKQLERSAQTVLQTLHQALIAPLAHALTTPRLLIIPHGLLHQLPFHALFDGEQYLLDQHEIVYAPSATIFNLCQQRPIQTEGTALVLGVSDSSIPHVTAEAEAIAATVGNGAQLFLDEAATTAVLRHHAPHSRRLHLACHGLFRSGNPMFSALKLHDGWFTASDVASLPLRHPLVTLSACESGRSQILGGDEILGLSRAFLGAGAAALAVSLWLVEDKTTALLMADWYQRLQQHRMAAALRAAQLALKEQYPHPYYWAPFILVGKF